jgi:hypothetical protein
MQNDQILSKLLEHLPTRRDDEVAIRVIEGRALSKNETSLHLALPTGLVAVPLDSITRVTSVPGTKDIVRLVIRGHADIRHLLRVATRTTTGQVVGSGPVTHRGEQIGSGILGPGVSTCDYYDTDTITGEEGYDASDDEEPDCHDDDEPE